MHNASPYEPIDYLLVGHLVAEITPQGTRLGGPAAYSALAARSLGMRVGVVSVWSSDLPLNALRSIPMAGITSERSTTVERRAGGLDDGLVFHHVASPLDFYLIPEPWRAAPVIHLAPVMQEVEPSIVRWCEATLLGVSPRGWLRTTDEAGQTHLAEWPEASFVLNQVDAAVVDYADLEGDERRIEELASACLLLTVTGTPEGTRVYWQGEVRHFAWVSQNGSRHPNDSDIFAALFFGRLYRSNAPWEAARFATELTALATDRVGIQAVPTTAEVHAALAEEIYS